MKRKFTIIIYNCMACICTTLKSYNNVCFLSKCIGNLALTFITPVSTNNCFYHNFNSSCLMS